MFWGHFVKPLGLPQPFGGQFGKSLGLPKAFFGQLVNSLIEYLPKCFEVTL